MDRETDNVRDNEADLVGVTLRVASTVVDGDNEAAESVRPLDNEAVRVSDGVIVSAE